MLSREQRFPEHPVGQGVGGGGEALAQIIEPLEVENTLAYFDEFQKCDWTPNDIGEESLEPKHRSGRFQGLEQIFK